MVKLLIKKFIGNNDSEEKKRMVCGLVCGIVGIALNILLFAGKLFAGIISGAVSIIADAFNNLSDAGSSLATIIGFKLSSKKPDSAHPYGYGRIEYLTGFIISVIIIVMGVELIKESITKIINPAPIEFSPVIVIILVGSILVKGYMALYNNSIGKEIDSAALKATAKDSLSDCVATATVLLTMIISHTTGLILDGWCGIFVALFIFYSGFSATRESVSPLLGNPPSTDFIEKLKNTVLNFDQHIVGIHDIIVHDYGPGRKIISLHAEVSSDEDILVIHDIIDNLEKKLAKEFGCLATIHMDPVNTNNPEVAKLRNQISKLVPEIHPRVTIHDFRVVFGETHTNILFDMVIPFECSLSKEEIKNKVQELVAANIGKQYFTVIDIDEEYTQNSK